MFVRECIFILFTAFIIPMHRKLTVDFSWAYFGEAVCMYVPHKKERNKSERNMREIGESSLTISMQRRLLGVAQHLISISTTCRQKKTFNLAELQLFVKYLYSPLFFPLSPTFTGYFYGLSICLKGKKIIQVFDSPTIRNTEQRITEPKYYKKLHHPKQESSFQHLLLPSFSVCT